jgi:hypothetical protein
MKIATITPFVFEDRKRWCLLYVPASGLFYDGDNFRDGEGRRLPAQTLNLWHSLPLARKAQDAYSQKAAYRHGRLVILEVTVRVPREVSE